jgi:hypothetical protein
MFVSCVSCVGSDFYDEMFTLSEESYRVWCVCVCVCQIVCDIGTSRVRRPRPRLDCYVSEKKKLVIKDGEDDLES